MSTFLDDLSARLVAQGVGVANTSIFLSSMTVIPTDVGKSGKPKSILLIRETGGAGPERTHNDGAVPAFQRPSAQLMAVAPLYADAYVMARKAYDALVTVRNMTLSGTWYREINPLQEPFDLGPDAANRAQVAFNVTAIKRPS